MAKYKNLKELSEAFRAGKLENWVLMVDNDNTYLRWVGDSPQIDTEEAEEFEEQKYDEARILWDSPDVYILDQALTLAGIPNMGV